MTSLIMQQIGDSVFWNCKALEHVELPSSLTRLGNFVFKECINLKTIIIPESVKIMGDYICQECSNVTIYCEAESKPSDWNIYWNYYKCPVVWGYKK